MHFLEQLEGFYFATARAWQPLWERWAPTDARGAPRHARWQPPDGRRVPTERAWHATEARGAPTKARWLPPEGWWCATDGAWVATGQRGEGHCASFAVFDFHGYWKNFFRRNSYCRLRYAFSQTHPGHTQV